MKLHPKYPTGQGGNLRRRLEFELFAPVNTERQSVEQDPDVWVDSLTDDEFGDVIGPSWYKLTGRNVDHLVPDHSQGAA